MRPNTLAPGQLNDTLANESLGDIILYDSVNLHFVRKHKAVRRVPHWVHALASAGGLAAAALVPTLQHVIGLLLAVLDDAFQIICSYHHDLELPAGRLGGHCSRRQQH